MIKEIKNTVSWTYVTIGLKDKEIVGIFDEKELQKTSQIGFRIERVIKRKSVRLYVKWKNDDSSLIFYLD